MLTSPFARIVVLFLLLSPWLQGCGGAAERARKEGSGRAASHRPLEGGLLENVRRNLADEYAESCDYDHANEQVAIATALDAKSEELKRWAPSRHLRAAGEAHEITGATRVQVGPLTLVDYHLVGSPQNGWQEEVKSWAAVHALYLEIRNRPNDGRWLELNRRVRSLLVDDEGRLEGENMYLDKDDAPSMVAAMQAVAQCLDQTPVCETADLGAATVEFLEGNPYFNYYLSRADEAPSPEDRRLVVRRLGGLLASDYRDRYGFTRNTGVVRRDQEIVLPLDPGPFAGDLGLLTREIEGAWNSPGLRLKIDWQASAPVEDGELPIFRMVAGAGLGQRAFVSYGERTLNLFPEGELEAVAHEVGHVLGFADHYYTVWDDENCTYTDQYTEMDIMSDHAFGIVTAEEWAELDRAYP